jgi:hypothetical protein
MIKVKRKKKINIKLQDCNTCKHKTMCAKSEDEHIEICWEEL